MPRIIHCIKFDTDKPGLESLPYPGDKGQWIYENVSAEAWGAWLGHQTMLINEYRLNTLDASSKTFLAKEMDKFFANASEKPAGYVEEDKQDSP